MIRKSVVGAAGLILLAGSIAFGMDIRREGEGEHRAALDAMELQPFPFDAVAGLEGWSGAPLTREAADGNVVLFVTWASWNTTSHGGLGLAQRLQDQHGGDGLLVVGVHHTKGWDAASKILERKNVSFACAHDASQSFHQALGVDGWPDFYLIDRSGNLRFADVLSSDIEKAVEQLLAESKEQAAAVPGARKDQARQKEQEARKTTGIDGSIKPGQLLNVPFDAPPASAYNAASWPDKNGGPLSAADHQGKALPKPLGSEQYLQEKPNTDGRVVVLDFWATWCGPCKRAMPQLDKLQADYPQDLVVIGISDEGAGKVRGFLQTNPHKYAQAVDEKRTLSDALAVRGIPHVVVLSSDGTIRWQGNPLQANFRQVVESCMKVDPGVKARKAAEEEFLRSRNS